MKVENGYYSIPICKKGHQQNNYDTNYCPQCGENVISKCDSCSSIIRGGYVDQEVKYDEHDRQYFDDEFVAFDTKEIPNYCHSCGNPYPWTEKLLGECKLVLELQSEEIDQSMQDKIYKATEEAIKQNFKGNSMIILKLMFNKLSDVSKAIMINILSNSATTEVTNALTK